MQANDFRKNDHSTMCRKPTAGFATTAVAVAAIVMLVMSCGDAGVEPTPTFPVATAVAVAPGSATFSALGDTARFTAEVRDQNGHVMTGAAVAWTSSNASVAAVNGEEGDSGAEDGDDRGGGADSGVGCVEGRYLFAG